MQSIPFELVSLKQTHDLLLWIYTNACVNGMEKALLGDTIDLVNKIRKYPLVFKIEE